MVSAAWLALVVVGSMAPLRADDAAVAANPPRLTILAPTIGADVPPTRESETAIAIHIESPAVNRPVRWDVWRNGRPVVALDFDAVAREPELAAKIGGNRTADSWQFRSPDVRLDVGENAFELRVITAGGSILTTEFTIQRTRAAADLSAPDAGERMSESARRIRGDRLVQSELVIAAGETLTIDAGTVLRFAPGVGLSCFGRLDVRGTADAPVWLVPADLSAGWANIVVTGELASAGLAHAKIIGGRGRADDWVENRTVPRVPGLTPPDAPKPPAGTDGGALLVASTHPDIPTTLENCTIRECAAIARSTEWGFGGAVFVERGRVTIADSTLAANRADTDGGAIYACHGSHVTVRGTTIAGNRAGGHGGAMFALLNESAVIENCRFLGNGAGKNAGALNANLKARVNVAGCEFTDNFAEGTAAGILVLHNESAVIADCRFAGNRAAFEAGACYLSELAVAEVSNCEFIENIAGTTGGALTILNCAPTVTACTVRQNRANQIAGAGGIAIRYGTLASGQSYDGKRLTREAVLSANTIANNRPNDLVVDE